jgi:hypothetical protein
MNCVFPPTTWEDDITIMWLGFCVVVAIWIFCHYKYGDKDD